MASRRATSQPLIPSMDDSSSKYERCLPLSEAVGNCTRCVKEGEAAVLLLLVIAPLIDGEVELLLALL